MECKCFISIRIITLIIIIKIKEKIASVGGHLEKLEESHRAGDNANGVTSWGETLWQQLRKTNTGITPAQCSIPKHTVRKPETREHSGFTVHHS